MSYPGNPEAIGLSTARLEGAYRFLQGAAESGEIPSGAMLVARHGVPLPPRAFGRLHPDADADSVPPETIFLVASVTKPVTVTASMLLVERGKLLLQDRVASILPEFGNRGKENVRIHHLMTHTSGLPDMLPENQQLREQNAPLSEFIQRICELELDFAPDSSIQYQSTGLGILGAVVERIEGVSLPEFLQREFFVPLGMVDTSLSIDNLPPERVAHINVPEVQRGTDWSWNLPYWRGFGAPWGGMFTTVSDMYRFCQMFLNGGEYQGLRLLSPATVEAMTRNQTSNIQTIPAATRQKQAWGLGWGLSWRSHPAEGWSYFGDLTSPGTYGHGGATGTVVWIDPVRELICIILTTEPTAGSSGWLGRCSNLVAAAAL